jgi:hypothetical protein
MTGAIVTVEVWLVRVAVAAPGPTTTLPRNFNR